MNTVSQPNLEIDFLIDSGATINILNNDTWKEFKNSKNFY